MAYRIGYCPQCDVQIMVQDSNGQWNSWKSNFRQADLVFEDGHRCRTIICAKCLENPDFAKIMEAILHPDSEACDETVKASLVYRVEKPSLADDEVQAFGKVFKRMTEEGEAEFRMAEKNDELAERGFLKNILDYGGAKFEEVGEHHSHILVDRGLPVSIRPWGIRGGMRKGVSLGN